MLTGVFQLSLVKREANDSDVFFLGFISSSMPEPETLNKSALLVQ